MKQKSILLFLLLAFCIGTQGQVVPKEKKSKAKKGQVVAPPQRVTPPVVPPKDGVKPYREVITPKARTATGLFTVHKVDDLYYLELNDSIYDRQILVVNRISKAAVSRNKQRAGYPGDQIDYFAIQFERGPRNKLFVRNLSFIEHSTDTLGLYQSVKNSNIQPIVQAFDIKAIKKDTIRGTENVVIDITPFLNSDSELVSFGANKKKSIGLANAFPDRSYVDTVKVFPINLEIKTVKTFGRAPNTGAPNVQAMMAGSDDGPATYELNSSWILLPKEPMKPRFFDPRVGYFAVRYTDFDSNPQGIDYKSMITRWRLEPKAEDLQAYLNGELVEPVKPIIFYIDPATPKRWVPYLMAGVNDWQKAFEQAGFKNAIVALEAPNDPSWSKEDARHSVSVYKPSDIANASGPHIHDPRSGEILESHINWYHNVMQLLHNWYIVQAAAVDPRARKVEFEEDLMGQLIRFVSSHEVGHTLGLRHNFGSSSTVPVENLRDKAWVEANGHTPSIMDYARFNYIAQPEDNISDAGIFPRIGIYDKWAIEWGYRYRPEFKTPEAELPSSNQLIIQRLTADKRLTFGTESDGDDPRNQNEDLGDNAITAGNYGIKNLKRIVPSIIAWTSEPNKDLQNSSVLYKEVVSQYSRYMGHALKNVGGIYRTPRTVEENKPSNEFVPAAHQQAAMKFLQEQLFTTPTWLIDKELITRVYIDPVSVIGGIQRSAIAQLINKRRLDKMSKDEAYNGATAYSPSRMFVDLKKAIWGDLTNGKASDIYVRNMQKAYVEALIALLDKKPGSAAPAQAGAIQASGAGDTSPSDAPAIARAQLTDLRRDLQNAAASGIKRAHYQNLAALIDIALSTK
jgi:hypothetical protein